MKDELIDDVVREMLPHLDNSQAKQLKKVLKHHLECYDVQKGRGDAERMAEDNRGVVHAFISAKRIEGCSEKTLDYYRRTIEVMLDGVGKGISRIQTEDLRSYLTRYQADRKSSRVTIDNIRRILSSFFAWLEDEDFILKSPVRRIHKVKTASTIKETYTDEALETMRDNCRNIEGSRPDRSSGIHGNARGGTGAA